MTIRSDSQVPIALMITMGLAMTALWDCKDGNNNNNDADGGADSGIVNTNDGSVDQDSGGGNNDSGGGNDDSGGGNNDGGVFDSGTEAMDGGGGDAETGDIGPPPDTGVHTYAVDVDVDLSISPYPSSTNPDCIDCNLLITGHGSTGIIASLDPRQPSPTARVIETGNAEPIGGAVELPTDGSICSAGRSLTNFDAWAGCVDTAGAVDWQITINEFSRIEHLAVTDANTLVGTFNLGVDDTLGFTEISGGSVLRTVTIDSQASPRGILPLSNGNVVVAGYDDPNGILFAVGSNNAIAWQQIVSGEVRDMAENEFGGPMTVVGVGTDLSSVISFGSNGDRLFDTRVEGINLNHIVSGLDGAGRIFYTAVGTANSAVIALSFDQNGAFGSADSYMDSTTGGFFITGVGRTFTGGLAVMGADAGNGSFRAILTNAFGILPGCADSSYGVPLPPNAFNATMGFTSIQSGTFVATTQQTTTAVATEPVSERTEAPTNLCTN